ncbi:AfsR/SARP family transcriptional regulator [Winogradskya consettensis]|uniref:AfsR/SARP family transcriptional regulator n=1 Tax=Winogradskya consettensis TaxID=113560 RepID=UPI001BB3DC05|nr:BTAD domain-containing putative transcriptional regulator [Actinoplanes consettensis]
MKATPPGLRFEVLGPLRVWRGDVELDPGPRQQQRLLAIMLTAAPRPVGTADLVELVWGTEPPGSAVNVIHKYVGRLRRLFESDLPPRAPGRYLLRQGTAYRFRAGPETLDLAAFRRHVAAGRESGGQARLSEALEHYGTALRIWRGPAGGVLADNPGTVAVFAGLDAEFRAAAVTATEIALRIGRPDLMVPALRLAAGMSPLDEVVHANLITVLAAAGRQAEALELYRALHERLVDDLGIEPGTALREAQRRVLTQTTASSGPPPEPLHPAQLPPALPLFAGRSAELAVLTRLAAGMHEGGRSSPLVVAMDGMGGVGTSTLATCFAHLVADRFDAGQLYLDLSGDQDEPLLVGEALRSLLYALGVPPADVPDPIDARVGMYRSLTAGKRFLLLLDNAHDPARVRPLLPNSPQSLVLITSRRPLIELAAHDGAALLRIGLPRRTAAREVLDARLAGLPNRATGSTADEIVELCGRLPLALAILGARLASSPQLSPAAVVAELRDPARRLDAFTAGGGVDGPRAVFSRSYRRLSPGSARLFRLLAVASAPGITTASCAGLAGQGLDSTRAQLGELIEAALLTDDAEGRYTAHVLVRAYAEELLSAVESPAERTAATSRLRALLS